ncbi:8836_t:CDS:2, partial [Acaulospora morrowiae]
DQLKAAKTQTFKLDRTIIKFEDQFEKLCYKCGQSRHIAFQCEKAINKEAAERQGKLERQMEQIKKMLSKLLENGQLPSSKKRQQHER